MDNVKEEQSEVILDKETLPVATKKNIQAPKKKVLKKTKNKKSNSRPFPADTLESAEKIAQTIRENNAGNPWKPIEVAKSLRMAPRANKFFYYTASSKLYGLTIGTRDSSKIELAPIGKRIVFAKNEEEKLSAYRDAFLNVPIFKKVYDYYKGGNLPKLEFLRNTLIDEFQLSESYISEFYNIYQENVNFLKNIGALGIEENANFAKNSTYIPSEDSVSYGNSSNKLNAFIAIPFSEKTEVYPKGFFDEVIMELITPAANKAGFNVKTARRHGSDLIHSTIIKELMSADLVIADLTEHNPNVLFEIGWRMANKKPIALIRTNKTGAIFDVDNVLRVFEYNSNLWKSTLLNDIPALTKHIVESWKSKAKTYADIFLES